MNPRTPASDAPDDAPVKTGGQPAEADESMDQELDRELGDTFPASDPLPWSHEVK